jgi:hypothetical protein
MKIKENKFYKKFNNLKVKENNPRKMKMIMKMKMKTNVKFVLKNPIYK